MNQNVVMSAEPELIYFKNYQELAGPLTEIDPQVLMREVNDDVSKTIGRALDFANTGAIGELVNPMKESLLVVGKHLIHEHHVDWEMRHALEYNRSLQKVGVEYLRQLTNTSMWVSHHPNFIAARYVNGSPDDLEVLVRYDTRRPQLEGYEITNELVDQVKPTLLHVSSQLLGMVVHAPEEGE